MSEMAVYLYFVSLFLCAFEILNRRSETLSCSFPPQAQCVVQGLRLAFTYFMYTGSILITCSLDHSCALCYIYSTSE